MNDWTAETAKAYETRQAAEENFINRITAQFQTLTVGAKVFFYNSAFRRNEWATVAKVVPTTAHVGYVVTDKGKTIWANQIVIAHTAAETETLQICLNDRVAEMNEAAKRAESNTMEVFADFEPDNFVVVNRSNRSEYRVGLSEHNEKVFASCECPDFKKRNRICKHVSEVLRQWFTPLYSELRGEVFKPYAASCEFGNFKRQHYKKSEAFETLHEAQRFIVNQIGGLQGFGQIICGGETVWQYSSDDAEAVSVLSSDYDLMTL